MPRSPARAKKKSPASPPKAEPRTFPVVAVGASAGGLEALRSFLSELPQGTGMAFVVVQHLDPTHTSMLPEILGRASRLPVFEVADRVVVEPERVYVMPAGKDMVFADGRLLLVARTETRGQHRPVDHFMRSIAEGLGYQAIGVVLSGTGSDGTLGIQEIKTAGGITFAQDHTAEHTGMPHSAAATGAVDFVLPPAEIAREVARIAGHEFAGLAKGTGALDERDPAITRVLDVLNNAHGVDFSSYKRNTLHRRITRRMVLRRMDNLRDYVRFLLATPEEVELLYRDILINVTSFFRNPEAYEALQHRVFPRLVVGKTRVDHVRAWALGCSTGEEAYSIAMAYTEFAEANKIGVPLQIFATDLNGAGIERARAGIYGKGIEQDVSPERLRRFFVESEGRYRISKQIRDMCVFARHNVLTEPPFSRMDLVACRNLLIYLDQVLQQKVLPTLHYALRSGGVLWLGNSETIGSYRDLFDLQDSKHKFYLAKAGGRRPPQLTAAGRAGKGVAARLAEASAAISSDPHRDADRAVLARYAPPGVVLDAQLDIVQFRGDTGPFLMPAPGRASLNVLKMLREGLLVAVRGAVHRVRREGVAVREEGLRARADGKWVPVTIVVMPLTPGTDDGSLLLLFEAPGEGEVAQAREHAGAKALRATKSKATDLSPRQQVLRLQQELEATRDYLQSVIEQHENANEELQAANEEAQSSNEELQSVNEELETSREEIQSSNEELATVNDELQMRNDDLARSNTDLANLLESVSMPIVMLDRALRIRRFTPAAADAFGLLPSDLGRPLGDFKLGIDMPDFDDALNHVLVHRELVEREVRHRGRWQLLRVRRYMSEGRVEGVVLALVDIDLIKGHDAAMRESEHRFAALADTAPVLMWIDDSVGMVFINRAFQRFAGVEQLKLGLGDWSRYLHADDMERFNYVIGEARKRGEPFEMVVRMRRVDGEWRWMKIVGVPRATGHPGGGGGYVGSAIDVTELKEPPGVSRPTP